MVSIANASGLAADAGHAGKGSDVRSSWSLRPIRMRGAKEPSAECGFSGRTGHSCPKRLPASSTSKRAAAISDPSASAGTMMVACERSSVCAAPAAKDARERRARNPARRQSAQKRLRNWCWPHCPIIDPLSPLRLRDLSLTGISSRSFIRGTRLHKFARNLFRNILQCLDDPLLARFFRGHPRQRHGETDGCIDLAGGGKNGHSEAGSPQRALFGIRGVTACPNQRVFGLNRLLVDNRVLVVTHQAVALQQPLAGLGVLPRGDHL